MKLVEYLDTLSWSQTDLSNKALVSTQTVSRALSGAKLTRRSANRILGAISEGLGKRLTLRDVEGLEVAPVRHRKKSVPAAPVAAPKKKEG